jgi:hypothetical protein
MKSDSIQLGPSHERLIRPKAADLVKFLGIFTTFLSERWQREVSSPVRRFLFSWLLFLKN